MTAHHGDDSDGRDANATTFELDRSRTAPAAARARTDEWMDTVDVHPAVRADILLAVSELVTNAVMHAESAPRVHLESADHRIRLEVHDASSDQPVRHGGSAGGGFGMQLVDGLAGSWGWSLTESGKVVWAEFDRARDHSALDPAGADG